MSKSKGEIPLKRTRIFSVVIFVLSVLAFCVFQYYRQAVEDTTPPQISMEENEIEVSVKDTDDVLLDGVFVTDDRDGDVSDSLIIESLSNFINENTRRATIVASDTSGNISKAYRTVVYSDYQSPRFSLSAPLQFSLKTDDITKYMGASDVFDGDLTGQIKINGTYTMDTSQEGEYPMEFSVTNSAGDVVKLEATVTISSIVDAVSVPQIKLTDYIIYTPIGQNIEPWDYVDTISWRNITYQKEDDALWALDLGEDQDVDNISKEDIQIIQKDVDYTKPGTYEILYRFTPEENLEFEGSVRLIVVVYDS